MIFNTEIDEVYDRHLLIAQNLAAALTRYHRDLVTTFELFANDPDHWQMMEGTSDILANLSFQNICVADLSTGAITSSLVLHENACASAISEEQLNFFNTLARPDVTTFSEVMNNKNGINVIHLVLKSSSEIVIGTIDTKYFQDLGAAISFGVKGHAAIVDHNGNALSHPLPEWVAERKDLSEISAVKRMMNAETGVEQFYSPALKGDMIAGFASVEPVGWGVMIPQPVAELQTKAENAMKSVIVVLLFGIVIALGLAVWISILVARPLEWVNNQTQRVTDGDLSLQPEMDSRYFLPVEFQSVQRNVREMIARLYESAGKVNRLAYLDPLTGIANRASFQRKLRASTGGRDGLEIGTLLFIDLDRFKEINDSYGHDLGDAALKVVAERICDVCRVSLIENAAIQHAMMQNIPDRNYCARLGGDEFAVFLPNQNASCGYTMAQNLIECLSQPIKLGLNEVTLGASVGIAQYPDHGQNDKDLLKASDLAMYEAKALGEGRASIFDPDLLVRQQERNDFGLELLDAITNGELTPYFQPQFCARDLSLSGVEGLVRWEHPVRGLLGPDEILPLAQELGVVARVDEMMFQRCIETVLELRQRGLEIPNLAVNISLERLFSETLLQDIQAHGPLPFDLTFELLETIFMDDIGDRMANVIKSLHNIGVRIEMDDFGSGHASVIALLNLQPDALKIDRRLVAKLSEEEFGTVLIQAIVNMGQGAGIKITAEGVETNKQLQILRSIGCDTLQGYHLGYPMVAEELFEALTKRNVKAELETG
ncbi:MAG: EAL domain-containing protein [Roseobacter sp.]